MRVKIQQVLPQGFDKIEPHSWECELYKEDKNGQILVPIDDNCREKGIKDMKIGDFVAVRLDEKSDKTGTIAGQIVEFVDEKGEKSLDTAQNDELNKDERLLLDMSLQAYLCGDFKRVEALRKAFLKLSKDKRKNAELKNNKNIVEKQDADFCAMRKAFLERQKANRAGANDKDENAEQFNKEALNAFANSEGETLIQMEYAGGELIQTEIYIDELKSEISRLKDELSKAKQNVNEKVWQGQKNLSLAFNNAMGERAKLEKENASLKEKVALLDKKKASKKRRKIAKNALLDILWAKEQQHINFRHTKAFYADKQRLLRWAVLDFVGHRKLFKKLRIVDLIITRINKKKCFMWFNEDEFQRSTETIATFLKLNLPFIIVSGVTTDEPEVAMCNGKKQTFISEKFVELANELKKRLKGVSDDN